jgi:hypothetical protein
MSEPISSTKISFWRSQFTNQPTRSQTIFDVSFGVVAPVVLLVIDPGVFRLSMYQGGFFGGIRIFAYLGIPAGIVILILWLFGERRPKKWQGFYIAGLLFGACFATMLSLIIVPVAYLGILFIGSSIFGSFHFSIATIFQELALMFLGFLPILTTFVYWRNAIRAINQLKDDSEKVSKTWLVASLVVGFFLVAVIPGLVQWQASRYIHLALNEVLNGDAQTAQVGLQKLKGAFWCNKSCYDAIAIEYLRAYFAEVPDVQRQEYLVRVWKEVTGGDLLKDIIYYEDN